MKKYYNIVFTADLGFEQIEYIYYTLSDKAAADEYVGSEACDLDYSEWVNCDLNIDWADGGVSVEEVTLTDDAIEAAFSEEPTMRDIALRLGIAKEFAAWLAKTFAKKYIDKNKNYCPELHFKSDGLPF